MRYDVVWYGVLGVSKRYTKLIKRNFKLITLINKYVIISRFYTIKLKF